MSFSQSSHATIGAHDFHYPIDTAGSRSEYTK